jgi:hypothetical protein
MLFKKIPERVLSVNMTNNFSEIESFIVNLSSLTGHDIKVSKSNILRENKMRSSEYRDFIIRLQN